LAEGGTSTSK
jgi:GTPase SAR1 family protein